MDKATDADTDHKAPTSLNIPERETNRSGLVLDDEHKVKVPKAHAQEHAEIGSHETGLMHVL